MVSTTNRYGSYSRPEGMLLRLYQDLPSSISSLKKCLFVGKGNGFSSYSNMACHALPKGRKLHVAIVGAGVSGLKCADVLLQHGVEVTILEARDRIGGRLHQKTVGGHLVDMGANWIHGTQNNPIFALAHVTKTATYDLGESQAVFDSDGKILDAELALKYADIMWGIISDGVKYSHDHSDEIPVDKSLLDYFRERIEQTPDLDDGDKDMVMQMAQMWGGYVGSLVERQSLKFFWLEETIDGENLFVASTYRSILASISATALTHATIKLNTEVTHIATRSSSDSSGPVTVTTADGGKLAFDEVVVTTPLGWLKSNYKVAFTPRLPSRIASAIESLGYGQLEKVYVTFPYAFWETSSAVCMSTESAKLDDNKAETPIAVPRSPATVSTKANAKVKARQHYPGFTLFTPRQHRATTLPFAEACSLSSLPPPHAHPTLLFYIFGPLAAQVTSLDAASPSYVSEMTKLFQPYYSCLPHYEAGSDACTPTDWQATDWSHDRFSGDGSYTNFQVGLSNGGEDIVALREGRMDDDEQDGKQNLLGPQRGLWFAGEHTSPWVAVGTVTGAWWSGEGVSTRLLEVYGLAEGRD